MNNILPTTNQILLESLEKWTEYRITVVAHTKVGPGPESSPVIIRTDEDGKQYFLFTHTVLADDGYMLHWYTLKSFPFSLAKSQF